MTEQYLLLDCLHDVGNDNRLTSYKKQNKQDCRKPISNIGLLKTAHQFIQIALAKNIVDCDYKQEN